MSKFKVGDRVVAISDYMGKEIQGKTGTVKGFGSKSKDPIGVEWDDFVNGHDGGRFFDGKRGCCWFVPESCIERLARRDPSIHITTDGKTTRLPREQKLFAHPMMNSTLQPGRESPWIGWWEIPLTHLREPSVKSSARRRWGSG